MCKSRALKRDNYRVTRLLGWVLKSDRYSSGGDKDFVANLCRNTEGCQWFLIRFWSHYQYSSFLSFCNKCMKVLCLLKSLNSQSTHIIVVTVRLTKINMCSHDIELSILSNPTYKETCVQCGNIIDRKYYSVLGLLVFFYLLQ